MSASKKNLQEQAPHIPVLLKESLALFSGANLRIFVDGTLGAGEFAKALLQEHPEIETYYGFDQDQNAIVLAQENLQEFQHKVVPVNMNFSHVSDFFGERKLSGKIDGFFLT